MLVVTFNQKMALVRAFSVIVNLQTSRRFVYSSSPLCLLHSQLMVVVMVGRGGVTMERTLQRGVLVWRHQALSLTHCIPKEETSCCLI